jgi:hypothetical protein
MNTAMTSEPVPDASFAGWLRSQDQATSRSLWLCRAPVLVAAAVICLISGFNLIRLVTAPAPRTPWESVQVVEAWRSLHGMPVYELPDAGHSTQVYGALAPWIQGQIFRGTDPNNVSGRLFALASALATVTLLALAMRGDSSPWYFVIAWAAILGANHRSGQYFAENKPDVSALLFAAAGVLLIGFGQERRRVPCVVLGAACLVTGFFFKQTAFIFVVVPILALVLRWRRPSRSEIGIALLPLAVSLAVILALKVAYPTVYYYMIDVPKAFALDVRRTPRTLWDLVLDSPLFLVLLAEYILTDARSPRDDPRLRWLLAVLAVAVPYSAVTTAKVGGWCNSLLPALLAIMAFCALRLPRLLNAAGDRGAPLRLRLALGGFSAVLLLMTAFPHMTQLNSLFVSRTPVDREYPRAVARVARLPGRVACPEDPTITLYAKGYVGPSIFAERDTHLVGGRWPRAIPETVLSECRTADFIVDIADYWEDPLCDEVLRDLDFVPAQELAPELRCFHIWRRKALVPTSSAARTAFSKHARGAGAPIHD